MEREREREREKSIRERLIRSSDSRKRFVSRNIQKVKLIGSS